MEKIEFKNVHTMIGADTVIQGDVTLAGGLIVYGTIKGNIQTRGPVRIARAGKVEGDIQASDIHLSGKVAGNVSVANRAVLGQHSVLIGDLVYRSLMIEEGAQLEGKCDVVPETGNDPLESGTDTAADSPLPDPVLQTE